MSALVLSNKEQENDHKDSPNAAIWSLFEGNTIDLTMTDIMYHNGVGPDSNQRMVTRCYMDNTKPWPQDFKARFDLIVGKRILCDCQGNAGCTGIGMDVFVALDFLFEAVGALKPGGIAFLDGDIAAHTRNIWAFAAAAAVGEQAASVHYYVSQDNVRGLIVIRTR
jgi:hypothetical protein